MTAPRSEVLNVYPAIHLGFEELSNDPREQFPQHNEPNKTEILLCKVIIFGNQQFEICRKTVENR